MIKLKRKFTQIDLLFLVGFFVNSYYLYKSYEKKEIYIRALQISMYESPIIYWLMFCFMTCTLIALIFFIMFYNSEKGQLNKS
jgi:hypothetical protein